MSKRSFWNAKPLQLRYRVEPDPFEELPLPGVVTLLLKGARNLNKDKGPRVGDYVKTGQRLAIDGSADFVISPVTGSISAIAPYVGLWGQSFNAISVQTNGSDDWDDQFANDTSFESSTQFLAHLSKFVPKFSKGPASLSALLDPRIKIKTIVITGLDSDLLSTVNPHVVRNNSASLNAGIDLLQKACSAESIFLVVPESLAEPANAAGVEAKLIDPFYPEYAPRLLASQFISKQPKGQFIAKGQPLDAAGVAVLPAEVVAEIGAVFEAGRPPVDKILTVTSPDGASTNVRTRIGTPIKAILEARGISLGDGDRIVLGGPMTGRATYSDDLPIEADTDGIFVCRASQAHSYSDYSCTNCGECVRICPVRMPVNMLVRFLDARQYEDAAAHYDLDCCIECGLCASVCVSRIPILQYIRVGKYELARNRT